MDSGGTFVRVGGSGFRTSLNARLFLVLVEGAVTMALSIVAFFFLPGKPEETKFLNDRERVIATERLRVETAGLVGI